MAAERSASATTAYTHLMVATDVSDDAVLVAHRALAVAQRFAARLSLMHVVDQRALTAGGEADIPIFGMDDRISEQQVEKAMTDPSTAAFSTDDRLLTSAKGFLNAVAGQLGAADVTTHVAASSSIACEVITVARRLEVDLLVCGAHHRHALALFFPSPVDGIIHHLPCDVLLVRLT
jgi:universal stress protein A